MANTIEESDRSLVSLDYSSLLEAILASLRETQANNPFRISQNGKHLFIDIDDIAYNLAINVNQGKKIDDPLGGHGRDARVATTNFTLSSKDSFVRHNREIRDCLQQNLTSLLKQKNHDSIEKYLETFWNELAEFQYNPSNKQDNSSNEISLTYNFKKEHKKLSKQRLTLKHEEQDRASLKFHRLTISIKNPQNVFDLRLKDSLKNYLNSQFNDSERKDELEDILDDLYEGRDDKNSDWYALKKLMHTEAIPKVQRTAKIKYLEYLLEQIGEHPDAILLEILVDRLQTLERYIDDPNKTDGDYQVSYRSESCNLKEIFSRADAFDCLPIIPIIDGNLGKIKDDNQGELNFIYGLKLKFGGKIQTEGKKTVLEYNLDLLNPESKNHQENLENDSKRKSFVTKVIGRAVLYFFVFAGNNPKDENYDFNSDLTYETIEKFEQKILPILKSSDEDNKCHLFSGIIKGIKEYGAASRIGKLEVLLKSQLNISQLKSSRVYPIQINVKRGILATDAQAIDNRSTFFRDGLKEKANLKYISVSDTSIDTNSLCYFSGNIQIDEIGYFETGDDQEFTMKYLMKADGTILNFRTIPILLYPEEKKCLDIVTKNFQQRKSILFSYNHERLKQNIFNDSQSIEAFIYRFTFSLLAYISLKIVLDTATEKLKLRLFLPILRLHIGDKQNPLEEEVFMRSTFAILSHLINKNHRSSTQGFSVKNVNEWKIKNGLSSLYSVLPKQFKLTQLTNPPSQPKVEKIAIVVVSSRECDCSWKGDYKKSNLTGELVKIDRQNDGSILVYTSKKISQHYDSKQIYLDPDIVVGEIDRLYQDGYRHILYIAKSPYSQTLDLINVEHDDNLYFMSPSVIRKLKGEREDLKIYPVFFGKYYAVSLKDIKRKSLYIQDAEELTNIVDDRTKQVAVFFNLFNGIKVGGKDNYYNGIISYSTLLNVYEQKLLDTSDIYAGLIDPDENRGLKNEILQLLTLFHFSRYEADITDIQLKLDPYQNIIGDDSVGELSMFPHMQPKVKFNCLAFLNEVTDALDAKLSTEG